MCQAAKSGHVNTARQLRQLSLPDTKWHSAPVDWVSALIPTTRFRDAILTMIARFAKRGIIIPCHKDMTADDVVYLFLRDVIRLKGCPRPIVYEGDKLFESQAWKDLAHHFKITFGSLCSPVTVLLPACCLPVTFLAPLAPLLLP